MSEPVGFVYGQRRCFGFLDTKCDVSCDNFAEEGSKYCSVCRPNPLARRYIRNGRLEYTRIHPKYTYKGHTILMRKHYQNKAYLCQSDHEELARIALNLEILHNVDITEFYDKFIKVDKLHRQEAGNYTWKPHRGLKYDEVRADDIKGWFMAMRESYVKELDSQGLLTINFVPSSKAKASTIVSDGDVRLPQSQLTTCLPETIVEEIDEKIADPQETSLPQENKPEQRVLLIDVRNHIDQTHIPSGWYILTPVSPTREELNSLLESYKKNVQ